MFFFRLGFRIRVRGFFNLDTLVWFRFGLKGLCRGSFYLVFRDVCFGFLGCFARVCNIIKLGFVGYDFSGWGRGWGVL